MFFLFLPLDVFKLSVSLKNYTVNMASPAVLSLLFSARCFFVGFSSKRTLHSYLKVTEPSCILKCESRTPDASWTGMCFFVFLLVLVVL